MDLNDFNMENLKEIRKKKKITQVKLSIDIGVTQELISQYEIGKSKPNIENLIKLADYFRCSTDYLLGRTNNPALIENLNNFQIENNEILEQYNSLSLQNKQHLKSYLSYLLNNN